MEKEPSRTELLEEIRSLKERLLEAEQTIQAIQSGEVDALIIRHSDCEQLYTLAGADHGYRILVESIPEGALILSRDNSIYYCNRTLGRMLHAPIPKLIGKPLDSFISPDARGEFTRCILRTRNRGSAKGEFLLRPKRGRDLPVNISFNCMRLDGLDGICAVVTDLSGQKRVEEELKRHRTELQKLVEERTAELAKANAELEQENIERKRAEQSLGRAYEKLKSTLESITDGFFSLDRDWRFSWFNGTGAEMIGVRPEEALARSILEIFPEAVHTKFYTEAAEAVQTGQAAHFEEFYPKQLKKWFSVHCYPNSEGLAVYFRDITDSKLAKESLAESEAMYRSLFENSQNAIFLTMPDGQIISANPAACAMFGMTEEEICRVGREGLLDPMDSRLTAALAERLRVGKVHQLELGYVRKDGTRFSADVSSVMLGNGQKSFVILRDISERKRSEDELRKSRDSLELRVRERTAELEKANEELRQIPSKLIAVQEEERKRLASELHDSIGQTFAAIKFWIEMALKLRDSGDSDAALDHLENFIPILQHSIEETRNIYMGLRPSVLDSMGILAALEWLRREFMRFYPERHIELCAGIAEEEVPEILKINIFRIAQEALNNVAKHSRAEWVDLSLSRAPDGIELLVSDDGVGMDMEKDHRTETAGSLGLTGMRERAELSGGSFTIRSSPGAGTIIRVLWEG